MSVVYIDVQVGTRSALAGLLSNEHRIIPYALINLAYRVNTQRGPEILSFGFFICRSSSSKIVHMFAFILRLRCCEVSVIICTVCSNISKFLNGFTLYLRRLNSSRTRIIATVSTFCLLKQQDFYQISCTFFWRQEWKTGIWNDEYKTLFYACRWSAISHLE